MRRGTRTDEDGYDDGDDDRMKMRMEEEEESEDEDEMRTSENKDEYYIETSVRRKSTILSAPASSALRNFCWPSIVPVPSMGLISFL